MSRVSKANNKTTAKVSSKTVDEQGGQQDSGQTDQNGNNQNGQNQQQQGQTQNGQQGQQGSIKSDQQQSAATWIIKKMNGDNDNDGDGIPDDY